ncbi:DUF2799 domain-containing protein [Actibacterium sp. 188UL27-1]|uniref:DUF2799 domain-containing protein n=1 Tax=Actibacterium sp. 188UL27-1 TaxID=2786961 RepID=UPI00195C001C|nr:DUF2799 domain-containing protein [Actibacterium sp. 188UL27-1]MBM7066454.1 DUF2799 domain-containing protein [Actibacterium sp. 188UL27-1]
MIQRFILMIAAGLGLSACASLTEDQCIAGDWYGIGVRDGGNGRYLSYINDHRKACEKVGAAPNQSQWQAGRTAGLPRYCNADNAYRIGQRGVSINNVCTPAQRAEMTKPHALGRRYHEITQRISSLQNEQSGIRLSLDQRRVQRANGPETEEERKLRRRLRRLDNQVEDLRNQRLLVTLLL